MFKIFSPQESLQYAVDDPEGMFWKGYSVLNEKHKISCFTKQSSLVKVGGNPAPT